MYHQDIVSEESYLDPLSFFVCAQIHPDRSFKKEKH